jgi:hypothetical protein
MPPLPTDTQPMAPVDTTPAPGTMPPAVDDEPVPPSDAEPTTPGGGAVDLSDCTPPPAGVSATGVEAWTMLNEIRLAAGGGCIDMVPELNAAAQAHCDYIAQHDGNPTCRTSGHSETPGCAGFTGETVQAREIAAGYPRQLAYTEVFLSYGDSPARAIPGWLVTPFHRIPMLDPWTTDMGWGGAPGCDLIDFGRGERAVPDDRVVIFPYDGQVDVPTSFNGLEAPMPPPPAGGFPSSYPISIYAKGMSITKHVLTRDGDTTPIEHLWLDEDSPEVGGLRSYFTTTALLYGAPFEANTTYRVRVSGTYVGGPLNLEWTFTTGAAPSNPWGF